MIWHLNQDISYCQLDGRLFFLDVQQDRYFQLSNSLEQSFLRFLESPSAVDADVKALSKRGLLSSSAGPSHRETATKLNPPTRSLPETADLECRTSPGMISGVFVAVAMMHWQLKRRRLKSVLEGLTKYRFACANVTSSVDSEADIQQRTVEAATVFNRVRPYVPIETCCLVDSLSMIRFLAKLGLAAHLVMGVACDPFSAHAWVQYDHLVLNDTVGNAQAYVPIRVI